MAKKKGILIKEEVGFEVKVPKSKGDKKSNGKKEKK